MKIELARHVSARSWTRWPTRRRVATFYHTGAWLRSLADAYPRLTTALPRGRATGQAPVGVPAVLRLASRTVLRTLWSLPFGTYGGPVGDAERAVCGELLLAYRRAARVARGARDRVGRLPEHASTADGADAIPGETHVVDISGGFDVVWHERFDKSRRRRACVARRKPASSVERALELRRRDPFLRTCIANGCATGTEARDTRSSFSPAWWRAAVSASASISPSTRAKSCWAGTSTSTTRMKSSPGTGWPRRAAGNSRRARCLYATCMREACEAGFRSYNLGASLGKASLIEYKQSLGGVAYPYRIFRRRRLAARVAAALRSGSAS